MFGELGHSGVIVPKHVEKEGLVQDQGPVMVVSGVKAQNTRLQNAYFKTVQVMFVMAANIGYLSTNILTIIFSITLQDIFFSFFSSIVKNK